MIEESGFVDLAAAHREFDRYLDGFERENDKIRLKIIHTDGVIDCAGEISRRMGLSRKDRELAELIALLHDIGRFEQVRLFDSFEPTVMDHASFGVEMLFGEQNMIRRFISAEQYDEVIREAIARHSDYELGSYLDSSVELHAKMIRDADKLDNCRVKLEDAIEVLLGMSAEEVGKQEISETVWQSCLEGKAILSADRRTKMDYWVSYVAYFYDINFDETCEIILENDYISRIIDRIPYSCPDTAEKMQQLKELLNRYMRERTAKLKPEQLGSLLEKLIEWEALEFCEEPEKKRILIPYVMNDAAECYISLEDAKMRGVLDPEDIAESEIDVVSDEEHQGLILRQPEGNIVTIWFRKAGWYANCWQYHRIGHAWRKTPGQEDLRRLVNLLCVLHDKCSYLGSELERLFLNSTGYHESVASDTDEILPERQEQKHPTGRRMERNDRDRVRDARVPLCTAGERVLADLAEFAPILEFTPINESIRSWYPESEKGVLAAVALAKAAEDHRLSEELNEYQNLFLRGKIREKQIRRMAEVLLLPEHRKFWKKLEELLTEASLHWPVRTYEPQQMKKLVDNRRKAVERYRAQGFAGEYPSLVKDNSEIHFVEEQAFTIMEEEDFRYHIYSIRYDMSRENCIWNEEASWHIHECENKGKQVR